MLAVFNTYTVFSFATVPVAVSADLNVTVQYRFLSGFGVTPGSTGPTISFSNNAVNVDVVTGPVVGTPALVVASCHFIKLFVSSLYSAFAGIFPVTAVSSQFTSFLTSNIIFAPCARLPIVPSLVGSNVTLTYPSGIVPGFVGSWGSITFGWLVNVIVPPSAIV